MGGQSSTVTDNSQQRELDEEMRKQKELQKQQLDEASKRQTAMLRRQIGSGGSLISGGGSSGQTLGG